MEKSFVYIFSSSNPSENTEGLPGLLAKAKKGQEAAFGELYNLYFKKIYRFIYFRVSHKEVAEDLAEDVFLKVFSKFASLSSEGSFEGWLYQIARNTVIDYYRDKKNLVNLEEVENTLIYESNIIDLLNLEADQKILLELIKQLATEQQIVLKLRFFEGLQTADISELLHKSEGAVRVIQHRAIAKLQELIGSDGDKPDNPTTGFR
jgi:RNA polymerase sigma-70 factor (ECF subfamily)